MAARKKRRKAALPPKSKAGRKKEIKRFELELVVSSSYSRDGAEVPTLICGKNEIAFVVRTSGGTPLNTTDTGKLYRLLQHELRALGHKLKRKGQELDPKEEAPPKKDVAETPEDEIADPGDLQDSDVETDGIGPAEGSDPDDSDASQPETA